MHDGWVDGSAATVMPHTGSIAGAGGACADARRRRCGRERARGPQLDELGQDRDRDLAVRGVAQVEPDRHLHPVEQCCGTPRSAR